MPSQGARRAHRRYPGIAAVAALNAVAAAGGAWGLASGVLDLGARLEARLPWGSTSFAAVALVVAVALPNAVLAGLAIGGDRRTGAAAVTTGVVLILWIVVELAFIRELSFLHPFYVAVGLLLVWRGRRASG
jgi:hypothetical protein